MNKAFLTSKLDALKLKSDEIIGQITSHEEVVKALTEEALIVKGKYQAIEELLKELPEEMDKFPTAANKKSKRGK